MPVIGYVEFKNAHIVKHQWDDRFGRNGISYQLMITKDDFEACLKDGLPAKHNEKSDEYFINITPVSKEHLWASIPKESAFVERNDIDCIFDVIEFTIGDKVFRKLYLRAEGIGVNKKETKNERMDTT